MSTFVNVLLFSTYFYNSGLIKHGVVEIRCPTFTNVLECNGCNLVGDRNWWKNGFKLACQPQLWQQWRRTSQGWTETLGQCWSKTAIFDSLVETGEKEDKLWPMDDFGVEWEPQTSLSWTQSTALAPETPAKMGTTSRRDEPQTLSFRTSLRLSLVLDQLKQSWRVNWRNKNLRLINDESERGTQTDCACICPHFDTAGTVCSALAWQCFSASPSFWGAGNGNGHKDFLFLWNNISHGQTGWMPGVLTVWHGHWMLRGGAWSMENTLKREAGAAIKKTTELRTLAVINMKGNLDQNLMHSALKNLWQMTKSLLTMTKQPKSHGCPQWQTFCFTACLWDFDVWSLTFRFAFRFASEGALRKARSRKFVPATAVSPKHSCHVFCRWWGKWTLPRLTWEHLGTWRERKILKRVNVVVGDWDKMGIWGEKALFFVHFGENRLEGRNSERNKASWDDLFPKDKLSAPHFPWVLLLPVSSHHCLFVAKQERKMHNYCMVISQHDDVSNSVWLQKKNDQSTSRICSKSARCVSTLNMPGRHFLIWNTGCTGVISRLSFMPCQTFAWFLLEVVLALASGKKKIQIL